VVGAPRNAQYSLSTRQADGAPVAVEEDTAAMAKPLLMSLVAKSCKVVIGLLVGEEEKQTRLLNTTLLSLFSFILLLHLRPGRLSPRTSARLGLSYAKVNVLPEVGRQGLSW
jgi:hypothetical protein